MQWKEVLYHLDYPGFQLKDRTAFCLLTQALRQGLQLQGLRPHQFPVEVLYRVWKNADSQVSSAGWREGRGELRTGSGGAGKEEKGGKDRSSMHKIVV